MTSVMMSDEELARRLQAEWQAETAYSHGLSDSGPGLTENVNSTTAFPALGDFPALGASSFPHPTATAPAPQAVAAPPAWGAKPSPWAVKAATAAVAAPPAAEVESKSGPIADSDEAVAAETEASAAVESPATGADTEATMSDFELARLLQQEEDEAAARAAAPAAPWVSNPAMASSHLLEFEYERHAPTAESNSDGETSERDGDYSDGDESNLIFLGGGMYARDGEVITKHDSSMCGRRNVRKLDRIMSTAGTGKAISGKVTVGNQAFNSLKRFLDKRQRKGGRGRVSKAEYATKEGVMDDRTRVLLFKLENNGYLQKVHGGVKTGKEGHVYYARGWNPRPEGASVHSTKTIGDRCKHVAIKIFRTTLTEFKNRADYMNGDHRFRHTKLARQNPRTVVVMWAEKEIQNLHRMHRAGIPCPRPLFQREHLVLMSFIGPKGWPAPKLNEVELDNEAWNNAYQQVVLSMHRMYNVARLVHGDLSEFNILYYKRTCYFIDVGQAVHFSHPRSGDFLARDCEVITKFFAKRNVDVLSPEALKALVMNITIVRVANTCEGMEVVSEGEQDTDDEAEEATAPTEATAPSGASAPADGISIGRREVVAPDVYREVVVEEMQRLLREEGEAGPEEGEAEFDEVHAGAGGAGAGDEAEAVVVDAVEADAE